MTGRGQIAKLFSVSCCDGISSSSLAMELLIWEACEHVCSTLFYFQSFHCAKGVLVIIRGNWNVAVVKNQKGIYEWHCMASRYMYEDDSLMSIHLFALDTYILLHSFALVTRLGCWAHYLASLSIGPFRMNEWMNECYLFLFAGFPKFGQLFWRCTCSGLWCVCPFLLSRS